MAQTALITGASRGIGRETALLLARQGIRIAVHYRAQREKAEALVRCLQASGADALSFQADVADREQVTNKIGRASCRERVYVLV